MDIIREPQEYSITILVNDPLADAEEAKRYGLGLLRPDQLQDLDADVLAVQHTAYIEMGIKRIGALCGKGKAIIMDIKGAFDAETAKNADVTHWRL